MAKITFVCHCRTGPEIIEESCFINIKYVLRLVFLDYFGNFFAFPVHHCAGFTMALSPDRALYTRLCHFLKRSIQLFEARKLSIPRWAATCRAFSFKWGPLMDALAVQASLNHARRMVWSSSNGEVFRDLCSLENNGPTLRVSFLYIRPFTRYCV